MELQRTLGFGEEVREFCFAPGGARLAAASNAKVWIADAATGKPQVTLDGGRVSALRWSPDGKHVAASFTDRRVLLWDVTSKKPAARAFAATGSKVGIAAGLAFSPDGDRLVTGDAGFKILRVWDVAGAGEVAAISCGKSTACNVAFIDDNQVICAGNGKTISIFDLTTKKESAVWDAHEQGIDRLVASDDG
jgi:WD40 repeat protein